MINPTERSDCPVLASGKISRLRRLLSGKAPMKIRQKMMLIVLSTSIVTLLILSGISFYGMIGARDMAIESGNEIGQQANQNSSELLAEQKKGELIDIAADKADDIDHRLGDLVKDVKMAALQMQKIHRHPDHFLPQGITPPPATGAGEVIFYLQYAPTVNPQELAEKISMDTNIRDLLVGIIERDPIIDSIFVTSKLNYTLSADNYLDTPPEEYEPPDLHYDAIDNDWYQLAVKTRDVAFTPAREFVFSKELGIFCAYPFYDEGGGLEGVACLQTTLDSLNNVVSEVNLRTAGFCFVVDKQGHVILSSSADAANPDSDLAINLKADRRLSENVTLAEAVTAMAAGKEGIAEILVDGSKYYVAYSPIQQTGWSFAAAAEEAEVMAPIAINNENLKKVTEENIKAFDRYMIIIMLITAILVLLLLGIVVLVGRWMSDRFVDPIRILSDGVRDIASGNLNKKIDIKTGDEVEHLAICFNAMTDSLKEYMDRLTLAASEKERQNQNLRQKNAELSEALRAVQKMRISRDTYRAESETDKLTDLYNKVTTERICEEQCHNLRPGEEAALYIIDLDHFKEANDTFGHQYGDRILMEFAQQLKIICRPEDCLGRFGGDEFVIMITGALTQEAILRKAHLIHEAARQLRIDSRETGITASIGIAVTPLHGETYQTLFQAADRALYCVKEHGRDGYCIHPPEVHR